MRVLTIICVVFFSLKSFFSQADENSVYKENQKKLDLNHSGIGFELVTPNYGSRIKTETKWLGFNFLADCFEVRLSFGKLLLSEPYLGYSPKPLPTPVYAGRYAFGRDFSIGANVPITNFRIGAQRSSIDMLRAHPFFTFSAGNSSYREVNNSLLAKDNLYYLGLGTGMRFRMPLITLEPRVGFNFGIHTGDNYDAFKWYFVSTGLVVRFNGRKQLLDPKLVSVPTQNFSVSNYRSKSTTSTYYSTQSGRTYKNTVTSTYSSADVQVSRGTVGVQDIGPLMGVGAKLSLNSFKRESYIPRGWLLGAVAHARGGLAVMGVNIEAGKIGHGSEAKKKKVDRSQTYGMGTMNTVQGYVDIGMDISPLIMSMLGVIRQDDGAATSFASITAGYSIGYAKVFNQQFDNPGAPAIYDSKLYYATPEERTYANDPALSKGGLLSGFFLGAEIGVVSFRVQGFKYRRAPTANNTFYSVAYKIPLGRR